jgi:hypothetical protein
MHIKKESCSGRFYEEIADFPSFFMAWSLLQQGLLQLCQAGRSIGKVQRQQFAAAASPRNNLHRLRCRGFL